MGVTAVQESFSVEIRPPSSKEGNTIETKDGDESLFDDLLQKEDDEAPSFKSKPSQKEKLQSQKQSEESDPKIKKRANPSEDESIVSFVAPALVKAEDPKAALKATSDTPAPTPLSVVASKKDPSFKQDNLLSKADKNSRLEKSQEVKDQAPDSKTKKSEQKPSDSDRVNNAKKGKEASFAPEKSQAKPETHYINLEGKLHQVRTTSPAAGDEEGLLKSSPKKGTLSASQRKQAEQEKQRLTKESLSLSTSPRSKAPEGRGPDSVAPQPSSKESFQRASASGTDFSFESAENDSPDTPEKQAFLTALESPGASGKTTPKPLPLTAGAGMNGAGTMESPKFVSVNVTQPSTNKAGTLSLRLMPENLGRIEVDVRLTGDGRLDAVVRTEKTEAFELFGRDSETLKQIIAEAFDKDPDQMSFTLTDQGQEQGNEHDHRTPYQSLRNSDLYGPRIPNSKDGTELAQYLPGQRLDTTRALDALV